jgi:uncharacterized repeat protein (TIGR03803 family)
MKRTSLPFLLVPLLTLTANPAKSQTNFTILKNFLPAEGALPYCQLVVGKDGALYGTTMAGGPSNAGTVFKISKDGSGFATLNGSVGGVVAGGGPRAGLVIDQAGNLYGTTYAGGDSNLGTVFKLTPDGTTLTTLHSFTGAMDGKNPRTALILGSDGFLYGTADFFDASTRGTVFKLSVDGSSYSVLHIFTGPDGQNPWRLIEGKDGRLYGTTQYGGPAVAGTVFTIAKDGSGYFMIHYFPLFTADGKHTQSGLTEGSDGALYGITLGGGNGAIGDGGVVFRLTKDLGSYLILHTFEANSFGGLSSPYGELLEGPDGALYGATQNGGSGCGTVFKLNKDGTAYMVLRSFTGVEADGCMPYGGLLYDGGVFYGTTSGGGSQNCGSVYALTNLPLLYLRLSVFATSNLVQFAASSGAQYDVLRSIDLSSWSTLGTVTSPVNGQISFPDLNPPQPAGFYRLRQH